VRDVVILPNTPFNSLDFASEKIRLGGRMGIDTTGNRAQMARNFQKKSSFSPTDKRQKPGFFSDLSSRNRVSQDKCFVQILWGLSGIFRTLFLVKADNFLHISSRVTTLASR
jgi:hypothetical protein